MMQTLGRIFLSFVGLGWFAAAAVFAEAHPMGEPFAGDRDGGFDSGQAMRYLRELCDLGPRISGSAGMAKQQALLQRHFEGLGAKVRWQRFQAQQRSQTKPVDMANLIVSWHAERQRRVLLCSHYDTRPIADQEPDRAKWREPFLSANDGTSGVALLMELGRHMGELSTGVGVDFVFFDGEEYVFEPQSDLYFFGSEYFAKQYRASKAEERYVAGVLLDMIAGKDLRLPIEQNSWFMASALVEEIWRVAAEQKCTAFRRELGPVVRDDHIALNNSGIPTVDIIDFEYADWHKLSDIPENCSQESIMQVARVLIAWLQKLKANP